MSQFLLKFMPKTVQDFLFQSSTRLSVTKSFQSLLNERIIRIVVGIVIHTLLARYLSPGQFGIYGFAYSLVILFHPFLEFGANEIIIRDLVRFPRKYAMIMGSVFIFKMLMAIVSYGLLMGVSFLIVDANNDSLKYIAVFGLILFTRVFDNMDLSFQAQMEFKLFMRSKYLSYLIIAVSKLVAIYLEASLLTFVVLFTLEAVLFKILEIIFYVRLKKNFHWSFDIHYIKMIIKESYPALLTAFTVIANNRVGIFFLHHFASESALGNYNLATTLLNMLEFFPVAICMASFPTIVRNRETQPELYYHRMTILYGAVAWVGILFSIFVSTFSDVIVETLYTSKYTTANVLLVYGSILSIFFFIGHVHIRRLTLIAKLNDWFKFNLLTLIINGVLQYYLTAKYYEFGAINSTLLAFFISNILLSFWLESIREGNILMLKGIIFPVLWFGRKFR